MGVGSPPGLRGARPTRRALCIALSAPHAPPLPSQQSLYSASELNFLARPGPLSEGGGFYVPQSPEQFP